MTIILNRWHTWVDQPKHDKHWHRNDIADEMAELTEATGWLHRWSELSDVVYTVTRARWSGYNLDFPLKRRCYIIGLFYMYPKYSLRVLFYRCAGKKAGAKQKVNSVRNPKKRQKLIKIANQNQLDPELFVVICDKQRHHWPLLP